MQIKPILSKAAELGFLSMALCGLVLAGCGGGGSASNNASGSASGVQTVTGVVYPLVIGLNYQTNSTSGVVSASGVYSYSPNESVTFSVGNLPLATVPAAPQVTPLPIGDVTTSTNMVRLLTALDKGTNANAITLPGFSPTRDILAADWQSSSSVAAALSGISPTASLPVVSDVRVTTTLANAKTSALNNLGTYGTTYKTIATSNGSGYCPISVPKDALLNLTSQPDWLTGAISGTITLTQLDNTVNTVPLTTNMGSFTTAAGNFKFMLMPSYEAKSRIINLMFWPDPAVAGMGSYQNCNIWLRDDTQTNIKPIIGVIETNGRMDCDPPPPQMSFCPFITSTPPGQTPPPPCTSVPIVGTDVKQCTYTTLPNPLTVYPVTALVNRIVFPVELRDIDGSVVSLVWSSSNGAGGSGSDLVVTCKYGENVSVTLTAKDDQGASSTKTWKVCGTGVGATPPGKVSMSGSVSSALVLNPINNANGTAGAAAWGAAGPTARSTAGYAMLDGTFKTLTTPNEYLRGWTSSANTSAAPAAGDVFFGMVSLVDPATSTEILGITGGTTADLYALNGYCLVGTGPTSCASQGINYNRSAGTITFTNLSVFVGPRNASAPTGKATVNGTLTFTPF